jgi:hypothetical protein
LGIFGNDYLIFALKMTQKDHFMTKLPDFYRQADNWAQNAGSPPSEHGTCMNVELWMLDV